MRVPHITAFAAVIDDAMTAAPRLRRGVPHRMTIYTDAVHFENLALDRFHGIFHYQPHYYFTAKATKKRLSEEFPDHIRPAAESIELLHMQFDFYDRIKQHYQLNIN